MTLGDRVVVMKDGFIEQEGSPMELYLKPKNIFVATFIGAPSMNILDATLYPGYIELENQRMPLDKHRVKASIPSDGKKVKFGIRPDFFQDEQHISGSESLTELRNVRIDIVEPLGYDRELNLKLGDQMLKARLDLRTEAKEGETINFTFLAKKKEKVNYTFCQIQRSEPYPFLQLDGKLPLARFWCRKKDLRK